MKLIRNITLFIVLVLALSACTGQPNTGGIEPAPDPTEFAADLVSPCEWMVYGIYWNEGGECVLVEPAPGLIRTSHDDQGYLVVEAQPYFEYPISLAGPDVERGGVRFIEFTNWCPLMSLQNFELIGPVNIQSADDAALDYLHPEAGEFIASLFTLEGLDILSVEVSDIFTVYFDHRLENMDQTSFLWGYVSRAIVDYEWCSESSNPSIGPHQDIPSEGWGQETVQT